MKGFTLIEFFLIIIIIFFISVPILFFVLNFYKNQQLQAYTHQILKDLRRAQFKAMAGEGGAKFGVYITNDNYTLFRGDSYDMRDDQYDEVFDLPQIITIQDSPKEAVFSELKGEPSYIGNIIISSDSLTQTINISEIGLIGLKP
ncbi:MAG: hypothetical protein A2Z78_00260 [Candidatus Nealsonbacteria bacterium RBG_13_36_15]|uniref:General secretion pathway GspH domain-containing protein n=1 Tax=Candidatus Nealsonbacteria bacterium RBG_13_36_15 TaxID=1801660 RepID=A0A1G2DXD9_9BACT|nr:MAG: hypothetical protein A2Z78_00260 [Candidatus Nealsonbacteria bacterium RBG_13_36_15]